MELSNCNWKYNCKAILVAALIFSSLGALLPDARGEAKPLAYVAVQEAGSSGASSLSAAITPPATSPGGAGSEPTGAGGRRAPAFEPAADLKTARRLLGAGATATTQATSKPSCTSNHVPCQPPVHA